MTLAKLPRQYAVKPCSFGIRTKQSTIPVITKIVYQYILSVVILGWYLLEKSLGQKRKNLVQFRIKKINFLLKLQFICFRNFSQLHY